MLAEIFFLRSEVMLRASEDRAKNSRFVSLSDDVLPSFRESETTIQEDVISLPP